MPDENLASSRFGGPGRASGNRFAKYAIIACLIGIAWYNALELIVLCFITFKRYKGCYFWALLVASFSVIPFALGYLLVIYSILDNPFPVVLELVAWVGMVTGQSLVLWSRLHLICNNHKVLHGTLAMIIINAVVLHIPGFVLELGRDSAKTAPFATGFSVFERIQLVLFSIQEVILSVIYSWEAVRLLNLRPRDHYRSTLVQLIIVNVAMILMDAAVIGVQYSGLFHIHVTLKALVYSIKLKLEYAVLGKLVVITEMNGRNSAPTALPDFVDLSFHRRASASRPNTGHDDGQPRFTYDNDPENSVHHRTRVSPTGSSTDPLRSSSSAAPNSSSNKADSL